VPESDGGPRRSDLPWKTGAVVTLLVFILMFTLGIEELIPYALVPLIGFVAWAVFLWSGWLQTLRGKSDQRRAWTALGLAALGSVLVGLAVWIPFALWVLGTIAAYQAALLLAVIAGGGLCVLFSKAVARPVAAKAD
jgi:hypothetical protein